MHSLLSSSAPSLLALTPARLWEAEHGIGTSPVSAWVSRAGGSTATRCPRHAP